MTTQKKTFKFRVLSGSHRIGPVYGPDRKIIKAGYNVKAGETFESSVDMNKKFPSDPPKFQLVDSPEDVNNDFESQLRRMSHKALLKKAEEDEIDVSDCRTKDEVIQAFLSQVEM